MTRDELPDSIFAKDSPPPKSEDYEVPTYRVVLHITADQPPSDWILGVLRDSLEDELESVSLIEFSEVTDRPTSVEHHGGYPIPPRY